MLFGGLGAALASSAQAATLEIGDTAPAFELAEARGGTVNLASELKANKNIVLYFYNQDFRRAAVWRRSDFRRRCPNSKTLELKS